MLCRLILIKDKPTQHINKRFPHTQRRNKNAKHYWSSRSNRSANGSDGQGNEVMVNDTVALFIEVAYIVGTLSAWLVVISPLLIGCFMAREQG